MALVTGDREDREAREAPEERAGRPYLRLAALVVLVVGALAAVKLSPLGAYFTREGAFRFIDAVSGSDWAPAIYIAVYAVAMPLALPGSVLTLAGGALFGVFWGTVFTTIGANIGANLAFGVARFLGRDGVERLAGDRLEKLDRATRDFGFRGLFTLRLIPLVPFNALNFGAGLTAIRWRAYALATALGIVPGTVVYTFFADALLEGSRQASREALIRVVVAGALLILLSLLPTLVKKLNIRLPGKASKMGLVVALVVAGSALRADPPAPGPQEASLPDHAPFTAFLSEVVHGKRVDYAGARERGDALDAYLESLARTDPAVLRSASRDARLAFWINAYNACMLDLVTAHYPLREEGGLGGLVNRIAGRPANSVWQISDVFERRHCRVAGEARSQDEIEHEIIRPLGEPRIHFAVNCAATSCPRLAAEAYVAERLDAQLDRQVRRFVGDPAHFRLEEGDPPTVRVNRVLDWYGGDFGGEEGVKDFLAGYLPPGDSATVTAPSTRLEYLEYDWTLNDVEP